MRVIGVIDLLAGRVVRGVAGRRSEYRPITGSLCPSSEPLDVARAFRWGFGIQELYVADLDAIAGGPPSTELLSALLAEGFRLWVDAGVRSSDRARRLRRAGAGVVVGLETLPGPAVLAEILAEEGQDVILSLDLRDGSPLGALEGWQRPSAGGIAEEALRLGVKRLLILDLARVGVGGGTGTEEFCSGLAARHPGVEILAGGGVRGRADLLRLKACGIRAVLVASALHDGKLTRADLADL
jgi:phosphoribosylformimino-5-aminoimidazole carboxamide ribotide isomerase